MRPVPMSRNRPTPAAIMVRSRWRSMEGTKELTWVASTWTSGSAMVMAKPMAKDAISKRGRLRLRVRAEPTFCPKETMPMLAPSRKMPRPTMSMTPPRMKRGVSPGASGAMVRCSNSTMAMTGTTEVTASLIFCRKLEIKTGSLGLMYLILTRLQGCFFYTARIYCKGFACGGENIFDTEIL